MVRGDFPLDRHSLNVRTVVVRTRMRAEVCVPLNNGKESDMQIKETSEVSFPGVVESPPLEEVVVLADSAGVALGVQRAFSARVRSVRDDGRGLMAFRCVEIPLVGRDGEI